MGAATWTTDDAHAAEAGYAVVSLGDEVWVGAPGSGQGTPYVERLELADLASTGRWDGGWYDSLGAVLAIDDLEEDGISDVLLGDRSESPDGAIEGAVYLLSGDAVSGRIAARSMLAIRGREWQQIGQDVAFGALGPTTEIELVAVAIGFALEEEEARIYAFDAGLRGEHGPEAATRAIRGAPQAFGEDIAVWDADPDGQQDLIATRADGVAWFLGPWVGDMHESDAQGMWTRRAPEDCLGDTMEALGDLTGDGAADLALSAPNHEEPVTRAGRAYVITSTDLETQAADDLPLQIRGTEVGEGMGYGLASADIDGDGQEDLVVGASGVPPGHRPGAVLVFAGPLSPGVLEAADATAVVHGEHVDDLFGRSIAVVDADGDAQDDLVIGAQWWPGGQGRGAVYLLNGADLMP